MNHQSTMPKYEPARKPITIKTTMTLKDVQRLCQDTGRLFLFAGASWDKDGDEAVLKFEVPAGSQAGE